MSKPTIVLVHGAFADASIWRPVFDVLDADGYPALAPPNPLRGVANDAAYIEALIDQLDGPVVLVGHSYSGAVITVAGTSDKVAGLVYVAGLAPDEGESVSDLQSRYPALVMGPLFQQRRLPEGAVELSVDPEHFHDVFCADVPHSDAAFLAHAQRSLLANALDEPAAAAAWQKKPSWAVFGTDDRAVVPPLHRFQYDRAGSSVTELDGGSHFVMLSRPDAVTSVIRQAVDACTTDRVE